MSAATDDPQVFRMGGQPLPMSEEAFQAHAIDQLGELREAVGQMPNAEQIGQAVAMHLRTMLRDPDTWADASEGMSEAAQRQAGRWLIGGVRKGLSKLAWVVVIGLVVYQLGGWTALLALLKSGSAQ